MKIQVLNITRCLLDIKAIVQNVKFSSERGVQSCLIVSTWTWRCAGEPIWNFLFIIPLQTL